MCDRNHKVESVHNINILMKLFLRQCSRVTADTLCTVLREKQLSSSAFHLPLLSFLNSPKKDLWILNRQRFKFIHTMYNNSYIISGRFVCLFSYLNICSSASSFLELKMEDKCYVLEQMNMFLHLKLYHNIYSSWYLITSLLYIRKIDCHMDREKII